MLIDPHSIAIFGSNHSFFFRYGKGKGISGSALPYKRSPPSWLVTTPQEVEVSCRQSLLNLCFAKKDDEFSLYEIKQVK